MEHPDLWASWTQADCVYASHGSLEQAEVLRRVATGFRRVVIDWAEGDRWVEARIARATEIGYAGFLLDAEQALRGRSVQVSLADEAGPGAAGVAWYMTPDTGSLELLYRPEAEEGQCQALARKLAAVLGYEFGPREGT